MFLNFLLKFRGVQTPNTP